jgi:hypothetical protein
MELQEIREAFRNQQQKYIYYLIALNVACIGFSVNITSGVALHYSHILLGIAIILWSISIFFGVKFIQLANSLLYENYEYLMISKGEHEVVKDKPNMIEYASQKYKEGMIEKSSKSDIYYKWQYRLLAAGAIFFFAWRIFDMAQLIK